VIISMRPLLFFFVLIAALLVLSIHEISSGWGQASECLSLYVRFRVSELIVCQSGNNTWPEPVVAL